MWNALLSFGKFLYIALFGGIIVLVLPIVVATPAMISRYAITQVPEEQLLWTIDTLRLAIFAVVIVFVIRVLLHLFEDYI
jgi:hypothetical protein